LHGKSPGIEGALSIYIYEKLKDYEGAADCCLREASKSVKFLYSREEFSISPNNQKG
jgi:hypothetical protein